MAMSASEYEELVHIVLEIQETGVAYLPDKDRRFFQDQAQRIDTYGSRVSMSDYQMEWLRDIHKRATK